MLILDVAQEGLMKKNNGYLTIGVAAGLFTATLVGLSIASYIKSRKRMSNKVLPMGINETEMMALK